MDHEYEIEVLNDNTTDADVDAMAMMSLFYHPAGDVEPPNPALERHLLSSPPNQFQMPNRPAGGARAAGGSDPDRIEILVREGRAEMLESRCSVRAPSARRRSARRFS